MDNQILFGIIAILTVAVIGLSVYLFRKPAVVAPVNVVGTEEKLAMTPTDTFLNNLSWRRAVKHFGSGEVDLVPIKRAIADAPSSFGIQPYKVLVITDPDVKVHLREACFDQAQVEECYALFIFCVLKDVDGRADMMIKKTGAEAMRPMVTGFLKGNPDKTAWAARQAYIALGFAMAAAAERKIASCPMEGFNTEMLSAMLSLKEMEPVALLAVGQYKEDGGLHPRFRFDDVIA